MISQKTVLTAMPIVLERVPQDFKLIERANPIIQGLSSTALTIEGYDLDNLATRLPEATSGDSEHTVLSAGVVTEIAAIIRQSMSAISEYVTPTCDALEEAIKKGVSLNSITDEVYNQFTMRITVIPQALLDSLVFNIVPDQQFLNGTIFDHSICWKIQFPELNADEIRSLCKEAIVVPELHEIFDCDQTLERAYSFLQRKIPLPGCNDSSIDLRSIDVKPSELNVLIVLNAILYKLANDDKPLEGVTGVDLDTYNNTINRMKNFVKTLLFITKDRLLVSLSNGLCVDSKEVNYVKSELDFSAFKGMRVLSGWVEVALTDTTAEIFNTSEKFSLSETILGLVLQRIKGVQIKTNDFGSNLEFFSKAARDYIDELSVGANVNIRNIAKRDLELTIHEMSNGPIWKEYLDTLDGSANPSKLYKILGEDIIDRLSNPTFIAQIVEGKQRVANTLVAVNIAKGIGAPIAANIMEDNINSDCSCQEKQRKVLSSAIAKVVVGTLLK